MTTGYPDGLAPEAEILGAATPDLSAEVEDLRAKYLRAVADYQNLRRRSEEERKEYAHYTLTALIVNYLPVLDDLSRALESVDADIADRDWVEGILMVERKFRSVLESSGVQSIAAEGQIFDPAMHEAIAHASGPDGQVVAVVQAGYVLDGKIIRPARVVVGNGPAAGGPA